MWKCNFLTLVLCLIVTVVNRVVASDIAGPDGSDNSPCRLPANMTGCEIVDYNWHYDPEEQECKDYTFISCRTGDHNSFVSEEECYKQCGEKLLELQPPQNVTLGLIKDTVLYLYWYPPHTYNLVEPNMTVGNQSKNENVTTQTVINGTKTGENGPNDTLTGENTPNGNTSDNATTNTSSDSTTQQPGEISTVSASGSGDKPANISQFVEQLKVPYHRARLSHYMISYKPGYDDIWTNVSVAVNEPEFKLSGLRPSTHYLLYVYAVYITNQSVPSTAQSFKTSADTTTAAENCFCDQFGTLGGPRACNLSLYLKPDCPCKPGYTGMFCEVCQHGFYRTAVGMPCHECPCTKEHSSGLCHFVDRYLHCTHCTEGYAGNLCHRCGNGYYRDLSQSPAICKKCTGCSNIQPGLICDPFSGACLQCENSTGHQCEHCTKGYIGDKRKGVPCLAIADACQQPPVSGHARAAHRRYAFNPVTRRCEEFIYGGVGGNSNNFLSEAECEKTCQQIVKPSIANLVKSVPPGVIAAVVIVIILVLGIVIGIIVYRRMRRHLPNRPFWTVELKEDHDGVSFSSVPEDEIERQRREEEVYDSRRSKSSQPYSRLPEET